jgi:hypothetical protein
MREAAKGRVDYIRQVCRPVARNASRLPSLQRIGWHDACLQPERNERTVITASLGRLANRSLPPRSNAGAGTSHGSTSSVNCSLPLLLSAQGSLRSLKNRVWLLSR